MAWRTCAGSSSTPTNSCLWTDRLLFRARAAWGGKQLLIQRCCLGLLVLSTAFGARADEPSFEPTKNYEIRQVEGWTVMIHPGLAKERPELLDNTLVLLGHQLYQVERTVPKDAFAQLRNVKIWIENFDKHHPCM